MTKKKVLEALDLVRRGQVDDALAVLANVDVTFVRKRLKHYAAAAPDHREAAMVLSERYEGVREAARLGRAGRVGQPAQQFEAPLPPGEVDHAPANFIDFSHPEDFLQWTSGDWERIPALDLGALNHVDVWAIVALACLRLAERARRPPVRDAESGAARFAHALGLTELMSGGAAPALSEPARTVRLTRVRSAREIEPAAEQMASLVIRSPHAEDMRLAIRHVLVELLRNVIQHSGDPLGAVVAAQAMGAAQRRDRPMIQLAVADAGIGIPRHLHRKHPHLSDYRQALERALLPHISGTFEEGLTGSFENAGLGLYVISEMARQTGGNLLIATTGAALVVKNDQGSPGHPAFLKPPGTGFPGTLVAFEIPTDAVQDYHALMKRILEKTRERTPKRASDRWITFERAPAGAHRVVLRPVRESTPDALVVAANEIEPAILRREPVELDFSGIDLCTQSWLHALLYESIRLAWARRVPIHVINSDPAVTEGLRFLEAYALGG